MDYVNALHYNSRREDPAELRRQVERLGEHARLATSESRRKRLEGRIAFLQRRLQLAEEIATYDWAAGEEEFCRYVAPAICYEWSFRAWRAHGVPLRVLRRAGFDAGQYTRRHRQG